MVVVIATMRAREGKEGNVRDVLTALVVESRQENGCLQYDMLVGDEDPAEFALYERWESMGLMNAHLRSRHIEVAYGLTSDLIEGTPKVVSYVPAEPKRTRHTGPTTRLNEGENT